MAGRKLANNSISARSRKTGFRAHIIGDIIPLRATDRAEENGITVHGFLHGGIGDGRAVRVIGAAADQVFIQRHLKAAFAYRTNQ